MKESRRIVTLTLPQARKIALKWDLGIRVFSRKQPHIWYISRFRHRRQGMLYNSRTFEKRRIRSDRWEKADDIYAVMLDALLPKIKTQAKDLGLPTKKVLTHIPQYHK